MLKTIGEFDLIERYFKRPSRRALLGVGDDCALIQPQAGATLAISCDMLVAGRHFLEEVSPFDLGHKALAVNLSDLAACGAEPLAFTLALSLPQIDEAWLEGFSRGLLQLADAHECELVGGDTTAGPLNICITVLGEVRGPALLRSAAQAGDDIYVSGHLADARLALGALLGQRALPADLLAQTRIRLERPEPRVRLGLALRGVANAAIDLSDGLIGDLGHVLKASGVGASLQTDALSSLMQACAHPQWPEVAEGISVLDEVLSGGDDYELLFTAPVERRAQVQDASAQSRTRVTRIGQIESHTGLRLVDPAGRLVHAASRSFDHFRTR